MAKLSPMMTYYLSLKEQYKEEIVLFRLGDFYEMFFDDAIKASNILDLTLTGRDCGMDERAPMCGVPYHAVDNYIAKLVANGCKVAICEQLSDPKESKGLVDRGIVRVITPGTLIDDFTLNDKKSNYLAVVSVIDSAVGVAWADISTGEFTSVELDGDIDRQLEDMLIAISPAEILGNEIAIAKLNILPSVRYSKLPKPTAFAEYSFKYPHAYEVLTHQLNVISLQSFECEGVKPIVSACGALIDYLYETQKRTLGYLTDLKVITTRSFMFLDVNTRRNLELSANNRDGKTYGTISWVIDKTNTTMGARMLAKWLDRPLINAVQINDRLNCVEELLNNNALRDGIVDAIKQIRDMERLVSRMSYHNEKPSDYVAIMNTLSALPALKKALEPCKTKYLVKLNSDITIDDELIEVLKASINENTPSTLKEGGLINDGFNKELDDLRNAKRASQEWLNQMEVDEREKTGIKLLKVGYNRVFGYYIEVPNSMVDKVPFRYSRKQTLTSGERYITEELKKIEDTVLNSESRALELELRIIDNIRQSIVERAGAILISAQAIATIDVLCGFAEVARQYDYVKPIINNDIKCINIEQGRHPVVEKFVGRNNFTANNTFIDTDENRTMVITGPNMAGKSTYMRQVAVITLLAHIGCFVPAKTAEIAITDRIFTRVGASDDLSFGQSTFMVEMVEVATILKNCTDKSLLILDEIGRGTSTCDGLSIAWAVIEYITKTFHTKTLFSTHYHELTSLEGVINGLKNYKVLVSEVNNQLVFTHRIARGGANKSFGIEVAKLAGLPKEVIDRAGALAVKVENMTNIKDSQAIVLEGDCVDKRNAKQMSFLGQARSEELVDTLTKIDTDNLTPMQAMLELNNIIQMALRIKND